MKPRLLFLLLLTLILTTMQPAAAFSIPHNNPPSDVSMYNTYDTLARRAINSLHEKRKQQQQQSPKTKDRLWIGIVGGPGAGKSTLATAVAERIQSLLNTNEHNKDQETASSSCKSVAIPMDGYHYTQSELQDRNIDMKRRGSPWTFDAKGLHRGLKDAKKEIATGVVVVKFPEYSREISDPVPDMVCLEHEVEIVLVEGNYLSLGCLEPELDVSDSSLMKVVKEIECPIPIGEEIARWKDVAMLWDETWFVAPTGGVKEQRKRLIERSLETWTPAKTDLWGGGSDREAATKRAEFNDVKNAMLVECCRKYADLVIDSV